MVEQCVIIGGGVASLSAANRLADQGMQPLLIEGGKYPSQRICGEFLSHECLPILEKWDIHLPAKVTHSRIVKEGKVLEFPLPIPSGSCSRYHLDFSLFERATKMGVKVMTETHVLSINTPTHHSNTYELFLSNGETVQARNLMIGTGKLPKMGMVLKELPMRYMGIKAHFEGIDLNGRVEIHAFDGGYFGMSNVDTNTLNIACIIDKKTHPHLIPERIFDKMGKDLKEKLSKTRMIFPQWLSGHVPEFGIRNTPDWERVFWIGDAAGSIPPISGSGLAIAVTSGSMAADYLLKSDAQAFKNAWMKRYKKRFFWAKQLHRIFLSPRMSPLAIHLGLACPSLPPYFWKLTREV